MTTPSEFLRCLESVLQHRRIPFERAAAIAFVESAWPLIEDEPDVWAWADLFCQSVASGCPSDGPTAELETAPLAEGRRGASAARG